jgi:hypothetical protein
MPSLLQSHTPVSIDCNFNCGIRVERHAAPNSFRFGEPDRLSDLNRAMPTTTAYILTLEGEAYPLIQSHGVDLVFGSKPWRVAFARSLVKMQGVKDFQLLSHYRFFSW